MQLNLSDITRSYRYDLLTSAISPRPIGLMSTVDWDNKANLAPFSFFTIVSVDPPILVFSPLVRFRNNTTKHTYDNCILNPEMVIHVCTLEHIHQVNICACDYDDSVDEFIKAGFTKEKALMVKPPMVKELPIKFECKVLGMQNFGQKTGGAGSICMAEIIVMHIDDDLVNDLGSIDTNRLNLVARMGGDQYLKVTQPAVFSVPKPRMVSIGFDQLPNSILCSSILTDNHKGLLAAVPLIPTLKEEFNHIGLMEILEQPVSEKRTAEIHRIAARILGLNMVEEAWQVLLREETVVEPKEGLMVIDRLD